MPMKLSQKILVAVAVPVVFELTLAGTLIFLLDEADGARRREAQARELASRSYTLMGMHVQRITQLVIYKSTDDPAMLEHARQTSARMKAEIDKIHTLVQDNPRSSQTWRKLDALVRQIGIEHSQAADRLKAGDKNSAGLLYLSMRKHFDELLATCDTLTNQQSAAEGLDFSKYSDAIRMVLYISIALSLVLAFGLAYFFNIGTTRRLQVIMENTRSLAAGQPPPRKLSGQDELAQIDRLYHQMHNSLTIMRQRERAILENVADAVCSIDANLRFTDLNEACHKNWGYPAEDLRGSRTADIVNPADREAMLRSLKSAIESGRETHFECGIRRADDTVADTEWSVTWSEKERSLYCVVHDVTARKNLDRLKREFVAMISHEIRTPLTSIQMTHSLLAMELADNLDQFLANSLNTAQDNVNRLMALVNNLLDLDKLESGHIDFIAEYIEVKDLVETSIAAIDIVFQQKSLLVKSSVNADLTVYADKERLVQVLINLLSNAAKYSAKDSEITVSAGREGNFVRIAVTDRGRGIPSDKLQTVFERFRQVEANDHRRHKGAGLGLAIAKAIVERHQGTMGVESVEGQGSTFWFTIPVNEETFQIGERTAKRSTAEKRTPLKAEPPQGKTDNRP